MPIGRCRSADADRSGRCPLGALPARDAARSVLCRATCCRPATLPPCRPGATSVTGPRVGDRAPRRWPGTGGRRVPERSTDRSPTGPRGPVCGLDWGVGVVHKVIHRRRSRPGDKSTRRPPQLGQSRHIALPTPGTLHSATARPRQRNSREQSFRARKSHTKERRQRVSPANPWQRILEAEPNLPTSTVPTHSLWIRFRNSPSPVDNPGYNRRRPPPHGTRQLRPSTREADRRNRRDYPRTGDGARFP